jgi:hypothetical protein
MPRTLVRNALTIAALSAFHLCGCAKAPPAAPPDTSESGPRVEVMLSDDDYKAAAPKLEVGRAAKFKGEISTTGLKGDKLIVHIAQLYTGGEAAVPAEQLTKDFLADAEAAQKKYRKEKFPHDEVIVEGKVTKLKPKEFRVILAGHEK